MAEKLVSKKELNKKTIQLKIGQQVETDKLTADLSALGFEHVDYVYEPGQFATRGSIVDVYSYSSEYPFRIDFFGEEIDSIRTFEVDTQLSKEKQESISIVPEISQRTTESIFFLRHQFSG